VTNYLEKEARDMFGGAFVTIEDPIEASKWVMKTIEEARDKLGINKKAERKLLDMKDRRGI
jgi:hypothetical protein